MPIVSEKKFLEKEELDSLKNLQNQSRQIMIELGEIEMIKLQLEQRYNNAKDFFNQISNLGEEFNKTIKEKYGEVNIHPETGEITQPE